jgi:transcriptional regulator with GAF, ATPase, and Fis domain
MSASDRRVREVFIELADTLVDDFDIIDFLDRLAELCSELLGVSACGILVVDHHGVLNLVAASTEQARLVELIQLQNSEGPCLEALTTGQPIQHPDLRASDTPWPRFAAAAVDAGYLSVQALPMRLRDTVIGALNLFGAETGPLDDDTIAFGQALADAATIGIVHQRAIIRHEVVTEQLQTALNSRVLIEQAKGFLSHSLGLGVDEAFKELRAYARANNRRLTEVAEDVVQDRLTLPAARPARPEQPPSPRDLAPPQVGD